MNETNYLKSTAVRFNLVREVTEMKRVKIRDSYSVYDFIKPLYDDCMGTHERFTIITLNNANNVVGFREISDGGITGTIVDIRLVAKYALDSLAVAIILVHNHPSGNLKPSDSDIQLTNKIKKGFEYLDIEILDHLIITDKDYFSFKDNKML